MGEITYLEIVLRFVLAVLLGGIVGFERERHNRPAGFRTHILVCVGSALVMLVSSHGFYQELGVGTGLDPSRVASQVVTGVDFGGRNNSASWKYNYRFDHCRQPWVVSGIGLAIGVDFMPVQFGDSGGAG